MRAKLTLLCLVMAMFKLSFGQTPITTLSQITDMSGHYVISQDINASGFTSITGDFVGTLEGGVKDDGTFYTITGLTQPLFVHTNNAILRNIILDEVSISRAGNVGAIVMTAAGNTRIYNCGILSGSVGSTDGYCGGLVGYLSDKSRVINCYSFADITGGTTVAGIVGYNNFASTGKYRQTSNPNTYWADNLKTMVMNCMFYGNITGGSQRYPVYGGEKILNKGTNGINNYDYYRNEASLGTLTDYNCSWPAEEKNLTRFEYYRSVLNSNRELASWYVSAEDLNSRSPKDTTLIAKWVLDPSIKPYPILKRWGKYPTVINPDPEKVWDEKNHAWVSRVNANPFEGKILGTLNVTVNAGAHNTGASDKTVSLSITDMDTLHYDYGYAKVQLPYYNELFGDPSSTDHATRYGNNYTDWVVTGWKVTAVTGGTPGTFKAHWEDGYNFADRYCTQKDLYEVSGRVFAQGGYYYVPEGVTAITIEAYWGKAVYLASNEQRYDVISNQSNPFRVAGNRPSAFAGQTGKTTLKNAYNEFVGRTLANGMTVYDNAIVLYSNYQYIKANDGFAQKVNNSYVPATIMSMDLNFDNEPDYCLELQCSTQTTRYAINPVRFDFVPYVRMGLAMKEDGTRHTYGIGICAPKGHFEMTETSFADFGQFEYDIRDGSKEEAPLILNGGSVRQIVTSNAGGNVLTDRTLYIILGGRLSMKAFNPGTHNNRQHPNRHCAVNVIGGEIEKLTLSGCYREDANVHADNPHCYMNGGKLKLVAGGGQEKIDGDVTFKIDHAIIKEFYGGGINANKPISGNIDVTIDHSLVNKYCGGPMFGDMAQGKTVTTRATGTTFGVFYGAGNGGTNYRLVETHDNGGNKTWVTLADWHWGNYTPIAYTGATTNDYQAQYEFELMTGDPGDGWWDGKSVCRFYRYAGQFAVTATHDVSSTLTDCVVKTDFYGGGNLGGVNGNTTSVLKNTHVLGSAYGGGFSAAVPTIDVYNKDSNVVPPQLNDITNVITPAVYGSYTRYYWTNETNLGGQTLSTANPTVTVDGVNYFYTNKSLENLGAVSGNTSITVNGTSVIEGNLFGAGNESEVLSSTNAIVDEDAWVKGSVYGGGNVANTGANTSVQMKNGIVGVEGSENVSLGNLFGGGKGTKTNLELAHVGGNTSVEVSGGTVVRNVYGGGELGKVLGKTDVMLINGATLNNVYGAGKGDPEAEGRSSANVSQGTHVKLVDGQVRGSIYGGGENGSVGVDGGSKDNTDGASVVDIDGGRVLGNVFGGGSLGYTNGNTIVNISNDGVINQNVYGGAFGTRGKVYVSGLRMVNMRGGTVYSNVYGGSRNADDALTFEPGDFDESEEQEMASVVNISGGHVFKQVFASGYFGNVYGSTSAFVGTNAIMNAPNHTAIADGTYNQEFFEDHKALVLDGSIWAGGDFGNYDGYAFGAPTITGRSDVYVDGQGYMTDAATASTDDAYMNIDGSIYGSGTSCDAGKQGRRIVVRKYGELVANPDYQKDGYVEPYTSATRSLYSIQRADSLTIDAAHINLLGQGLVNSLITTEMYTIHEFDNIVRLANGCSVFLHNPVEQVKKLGSYTCEDVYVEHPVYTTVTNDSLSTTGNDNKMRINDGSYVAVKYDDTYGELQGFAYVMTDAFNNTLAYARPKQSQESGNMIPEEYDNEEDGGFVSYTPLYNIYDLAGALISGGGSNQLRYENHTPNMRGDTQYFRVWRYGDIHSNREGVFNAIAQNGEGFSTVDVLIDLPASGGSNSYFRIKSIHGVPSVNYGTDVQTVNAGCYGATSAEDWMYLDHYISGDYVTGLGVDHDSITTNMSPMLLTPNNTFGLVAIPQGSLVGEGNDNLLFHPFADNRLVAEQWYNIDNTSNPEVLFRLTYNNQLTGNFTWEPLTIVFEQVRVVDGNETIIDEVTVTLVINTTTSIEQDITAQSFALMRGKGTDHDTYVTKVMAPAYLLHMTEFGDLSKWYLTDVKWTKRPQTEEEQQASIEVPYEFVGGEAYVGSTEKFGMSLKPSLNVDNSSGWSNNVNTIPVLDAHTYLNYSGNTPYYLGETDGRYSIAFDFVLNYDGSHYADNDYMGLLEFDMYFTNYKTGDPDHEYRRDFKIFVEVYRRGQGTRYYIDGVNGRNDYSGTYPNAAKPNLAGILYFTDFQPGDEIYIVNTVTVNDANGLNWYGQEHGELTLYRYPGGHNVYHGVDNQPHWEGYDIEHNPAFLGTLLDVHTSMNISAVTLDGSSIAHTSTGYPEDPAVVAEAPMINIADGATLTVFGNSSLQNNANGTTNGGAVYVADNGNFIIYDGSTIVNNSVAQGEGGGVYVAPNGNMLVSDVITINDNHKGDDQNNVYLEDYNTVIHVGTANPNDYFVGLDPTSKLGITKTDWDDELYYMPVLYSDEGMDYLGNLARNIIVFDDQSIYAIEQLDPIDPENHLYYVRTWTNVQRTAPSGFNASAIDTPEELAWAISLVNGLNGQTAQPTLNMTLTGDIDMSAEIWDVIGDGEHPYSGHFNGNGYFVSGIHSLLNREGMGMFGKTEDAVISDMVINTEFEDGTDRYLGAVIGTMQGGSLSNVEAAGTLHGNSGTIAMGGLVGKSENGTVHSSFAVNTMQGSTSTSMGGLVGLNSADLYNSYSNVVMTGSDKMGGLAGINNGTIENCYVVSGSATYPSFAFENNGTIVYCYADNEGNYVGGGYDPSGHGTYGDVMDRHAYGYMYYDNIVNATNSYVPSGVIYTDNQIDKWQGLLSVLNQWVKAKSTSGVTYTNWLRPTSKAINGDLPVLCFGKDNCLGTEDGKFLLYSATSYNADGENNANNGLDKLLDNYADKTANIFLYNTATNVTKVPTDNVNVFINEDAVLLQSANAGEFKNATVGVTFDNSWKKAVSTGDPSMPLNYDWHLMSTPLSNAPMGISWSEGQANWWDTQNWNDAIGQVTGVSGSYLPDGVDNVQHWDFYCYDEPNYHWINFKRNSSSHAHFDEPHDWISYDNEAYLVPGKGYMAAIDKDSYLSNTGILNMGNVKVTLTAQAPIDHDWFVYDRGSNLIGNPYQAYLDLNEVAAKTHFTTFYIYEAESGIYVPFAYRSSKNPVVPSQYIHPHQAFFVLKDATDEEEDFTFTYDMATVKRNEYSYFREDHVDYPVVNLFVNDESGHRDLTIIELGRPELGGALKTKALRNASFQLYSHFGDRNYGLLFTPKDADRVSVQFKPTVDGTYTMTWGTCNGTFTNLVLVDNITGTRTNMLQEDHYTFTGSKYDYAARFYILFSYTDVDEFDSDDKTFAFFNGNEWVISGQGQLELVDMSGRILMSQYVAGEQTHLQFDGYAKGVYVLRMTGNKSVITQKIVVR